MSVLSRLVEVLFPPLCPVCREGLSDEGMCAGCMETVRWIERPFCTVCGIPFSAGTGEHRCAECIKRSQPFERARSAVYYQGAGLKAIRKFKYRYDMTVEPTLERFVTHGFELLDVAHLDLMVPVPLHTRRLKERGFNQALLIARILSKHTGIAVDWRSLRRISYTGPQVALEEKERLVNVRNAFRVEEEGLFRNKKVLLVDDVMTTGATIKECARTLKRAGAQVYALTVARVV